MAIACVILRGTRIGRSHRHKKYVRIDYKSIIQSTIRGHLSGLLSSTTRGGVQPLLLLSWLGRRAN